MEYESKTKLSKERKLMERKEKERQTVLLIKTYIDESQISK